MLLAALLLLSTQLLGRVAARLGQPRVIGELLAGVLLGTLGFGPGGTGVVRALGQAALAVYVLRVVVGLDLRALRAERGPVLRVAVVSFVVPFAAGLGVAVALGRTGAAALLFLATAFAVTAFPVLARMVADRGLSDTRAGRIALGAAATQELLVWPLVGVSVALAGRGGPAPVEAVLVLGAFATGLALPVRRRPQVLAALDAPLPRRALAVLLPLFFAVPALRVDLPHLDVGLLAAVLAVAVTAKFGSATLAARLPLREALTIGALMNTRGLVELVVLSAGLSAGLVDARLYTAMVAMALITTVTTGPVLTRLGRGRGGRKVGALCARTASS